jgi:hypothetical protein
MILRTSSAFSMMINPAACGETLMFSVNVTSRMAKSARFISSLTEPPRFLLPTFNRYRHFRVRENLSIAVSTEWTDIRQPFYMRMEGICGSSVPLWDYLDLNSVFRSCGHNTHFPLVREGS